MHRAMTNPQFSCHVIGSDVFSQFSPIIYSTSVLVSGIYAVWGWLEWIASARFDIPLLKCSATHIPVKVTSTCPYTTLFNLRWISAGFSLSSPEKLITYRFCSLVHASQGLPILDPFADIMLSKWSKCLLAHKSKEGVHDRFVLQLSTIWSGIFKRKKCPLLLDSASYQNPLIVFSLWFYNKF